MSTPEICRQCGKLAFPGETVTIPAAEYEELRRIQAARTKTVARTGSRRLMSRGKIARDAELADFIVSVAESMTLKEVRAACVARFGEDRTPDRSVIGRFLNAEVGVVREQMRPRQPRLQLK